MDDRAAEAAPSWREPMLATLTERRFDDPEWIFERKFDGVRCLAFGDGRSVSLRSRHRQSLDETYPEVVDALAAQRMGSFVLDGEVVAFEGRCTSFARLQQRSGISDARAARETDINVYYYVFDLLHLNGYDTRRLPLTGRKELLRTALDFADPIRFTSHRRHNGIAAYVRACHRGDEGVIAKRAPSAYRSGRSSAWLKFKCVRDQELVVGGFTEPDGSREGLGALLVGYYDGPDLTYAGKVGTGFDTSTLRRLRAALDRLEQTTAPFAGEPVGEASVHWVRPDMVVQVGFTEWTRAGRLRHPRYLGVRHDKDPGGVVRERG